MLFKSYKIKHKILKELNKNYEEGERQSNSGSWVTNWGKRLTNIEIHNRTSFSVNDVNTYCRTLYNSGYIDLIDDDIDSKSRSYIIKPLGQNAAIEKTFLKERNSKIWIRTSNILSIIFGLGGFLFGLFSLLKSGSYEDDVKQLDKRIQKIEKIMSIK